MYSFSYYMCRYVLFRKVEKIGHDFFAASFKPDNIIFRYTHDTHISIQFLGRVILFCVVHYVDKYLGMMV